MEQRSIFLVGPMGAGKTTLGKRLAKALRREFYDSDYVIEERTGVDIPYIFEKEGETGFRKREVAVIDELTQLPELIVATGGGAVTQEENRRNLINRGIVVYLETPVELQMARTARCDNRPLLAVDDRQQKLAELYEYRHPLYQEVADITVLTGQESAAALCKRILREVEAL
jgi:shikimate kinase